MKLLGKLIIIICTGVLVGVCVSFWVEAQKWQGNYDRCIEVVKLYKNAKG